MIKVSQKKREDIKRNRERLRTHNEDWFVKKLFVEIILKFDTQKETIYVKRWW